MTLRAMLQVLAVIRMELRKTFFARRGLWVYLLALAPVLLFLAHSMYAPREQARLARLSAAHPVSTQSLRAIGTGAKVEQVVKELGEPYAKRVGRHRRQEGQFIEHGVYRYTDGKSDVAFVINDGAVVRIQRNGPETLPKNSLVFATIFQFYYLRLAIFFGCAGIFMNLFRGEMLDRSLHFYLLTPIRREFLLAGKYLAGLIATVVIFGTGTALQWAAMLWQFDHATVAAHLAASGWAHLGSYLGVTVLACLGYGSIFLAAGLLFGNPIIPAATVLLWESANLFLPAALKQISLIFYLQSLSPVPAAPELDMPIPLKLLIAGATPATTTMAVGGIVVFTLLVLLTAGFRARRLEINYSAD